MSPENEKETRLEGYRIYDELFSKYQGKAELIFPVLENAAVFAFSSVNWGHSTKHLIRNFSENIKLKTRMVKEHVKEKILEEKELKKTKASELRLYEKTEKVVELYGQKD